MEVGTNGIGSMFHARKNTTIELPGGDLDLVAPLPQRIHLEDLARGLGKLCRWSGQIDGFYSVAEHSLLVARLCPERWQLDGLLHDAHEALMGDIITPVKWAIGYSRIRKIEDRLLRAVYMSCGVPLPDREQREAVQRADAHAARIEYHHLKYGKGGGNRHPFIRRLVPEEAAARWLASVHCLIDGGTLDVPGTLSFSEPEEQESVCFGQLPQERLS